MGISKLHKARSKNKAPPLSPLSLSLPPSSSGHGSHPQL
jgi:hypothetical protein